MVLTSSGTTTAYPHHDDVLIAMARHLNASSALAITRTQRATRENPHCR